ncbi:MAG: inorganic phosphate transporter [bacterium]
MIISFLKTLCGGYLAWGMGANDCANVFGPHVGSNLLDYRTCVIIFCVFVVIGSVGYGQSMVTDAASVMPKRDVIKGISSWKLVNLAVLVTFSAGLAVNIATAFGIPTSTSQGSIGAFFGLSIALGIQGGDLGGLPPWLDFGKMVLSWVISPFFAAFTGFILEKYGRRFADQVVTNERNFNLIIRVLLVLAGIYGAFILGASHAGIAVAPFYTAGIFAPLQNSLGLGIPAKAWAAGFGGVAIALGAATYAHKVIYSVGVQITTLDPFSAFSSVVAMSICVNLFKNYGVPVSSSQAIVGAVAGVGLTRGARAVSYGKLQSIAIGWVATPLFPAVITGFVYSLLISIF